MQGDLPTIEPEAVRAALAPLDEDAVDIATIVAEIRREREKTDPNVVKAVVAFTRGGKNGVPPSAARSISAAPPCRRARGRSITISASTPIAAPRWRGSWRCRRGILERRERLEQLRALEAGMRIDAALVDTVPLGVDTEHDLARARELLERR